MASGVSLPLFLIRLSRVPKVKRTALTSVAIFTQ